MQWGKDDIPVVNQEAILKGNAYRVALKVMTIHHS